VDLSFRSFIATAIILLFAGCTPKKCGIDEDAFNTLSQARRDAICLDFAKNQQQLELIRADEARERAKKESIESAYEQEKIKRAYSNSAFGSVVDIEIFGGVIRQGERQFHIARAVFPLADGEAKKISLTSYDLEYGNPIDEVWFAYRNHRVYVNISPNPNKSNFSSHIC
jgi:hypothetical protein